MHMASARPSLGVARWCRTRCAVPLVEISEPESRPRALARLGSASTVEPQTEPWGVDGTAGTRTAALFVPLTGNLHHRRQRHRHSRWTIRNIRRLLCDRADLSTRVALV